MKNLLTVDPRLTISKMEDVLDEPKIIRVNKFDEEALEKFEEEINEAQNHVQPVVPILIDSFGGAVFSLLGFIAAIESTEKPVATIVTTKAMSCGAILFCFGTEGYRYMHPDAILMIHDISGIAWGKIEDVKADAKNLEHIHKKVYKKMAKQLRHPSDYILDLIRANNHVDLTLTAKKAKKHNIVNHIKVPRLETKINLEMTFG